MDKLTADKYYMKVAQLTSELSYCQRRKVGAVLVKDDAIISMGFNGTPSGRENCCEIEGKTKPEVLHAESNAISKCAKWGRSTNGATIYVTDEPCIECAKLIIQTGIKRVVFLRDYHTHDGINLLKDVGISVERLTELGTVPLQNEQFGKLIQDLRNELEKGIYSEYNTIFGILTQMFQMNNDTISRYNLERSTEGFYSLVGYDFLTWINNIHPRLKYTRVIPV